MSNYYASTATRSNAIEINKVLKNTYLLLSLTLFAGAAAAYYAAATEAPMVNRWLYLAFAIGMPMLINATRNSVWGLVSCFAYTTGLGYIAGAVISIYVQAIGPQVPIYAFATTAAAFVGLSGYALVSKRDFSFMRNMLVVSSICVLAAIVANMFLQISFLSLLISSAVVVLSSLGILYSTSQAINGGEDNYIVLASSIYADLWAMFMSLMNIFGFFGGDD